MSKNKTVLVIADTHEPFCHEGYLPFIKRIAKFYKPDIVVHIGDLVDNHAISYHEKDPNGMSPLAEMEETDKRLKAWFKAFPDVLMCRGNHDRLVDRKSRTAGLPDRCFRDFRDIWNLPKGWVDDFSFIIDGVCYTHGSTAGRYAHVHHAIDNRMSTVIGHLHSVAGVEYLASEKDVIFGMCVGCGIDRHKYAFDYGRDFRKKPILGCGIVQYTVKGVNATFLPMKMV